MLLAAATVSLGVPTLVRLVGDQGRTFLVLAAVVVPLLVIPLLVLAVAQLLLRRRAMALLTTLLLAINVVWLVPLFVADTPQQGEALTVLTANLMFGEADPAALVRMVREQHVDVLATEELTPDAITRLRAAGLEDLLPYGELAPHPSADGCGLWSRYPIDRLPPFRARFQAPGAVVHLPSRDVVVRVLHPFPTNVENGGGLYRRDYAALTSQVERLDPMATTVLAGDFNASTDNGQLRRLMGDRFRDASEVAGSGLQRTWSPRLGWPALIHLDHVLVDQHVDVRSTEVLDLPGSDHRALLARLVLA